MKKIKIFSIILALSLAFSCFYGCKNKGDSNDGGKNNTLDYTPTPTYEGTHIYNVSPTSDKIVENGTTEYKIVQPRNPQKAEETAVSELVFFFREATGITLQVVTDNTVSFTPNAKYLSVGNTTIAQSAQVDAPYDVLGVSGLRIKTSGKSVFMRGATDKGSLYAVYEFLTQSLNYQFYADNAIQINRNVTDLPLMNYDITDVPDYQQNTATFGYIRMNRTTCNRYRMINDSDLIIPVGPNLYHNSFDWLPKETHQQSHPEWYSLDGDQLCYTAGGDEASLAEMVDVVAEKMKTILQNSAYDDKNIITITHQDNWQWCDCESCLSELATYGTNAAVMIKFVNKVKAKIDEWFLADGADYSRDLKILFFGYHQTNKPPVVFDQATGKYKPIDDSVVCLPGVGVYFAESAGDYTQSLYGENNKEIRENMEGYGVLTDTLCFWSYQVNFTKYLTPYNSFNGMQETYLCGVLNNAYFMFDQGQYNETGNPTGWCKLKAYLSSKLAWDVNADLETLTQNFFDGYFGPASSLMKEMFDGFRLQSIDNELNNGYSGLRNIHSNALQAKYWPQQLVQKWLDLTSQALEIIETTKQDYPLMYESYKINVNRERLSPLYMMVELYESSQTVETIQAYKSEFYNVATHAGLLKEGETRAEMSDLYVRWGI